MAYAESCRSESRTQLSSYSQAEYGQYFTNRVIAEYLATMFDIHGSNISLLDPGAGSGVLTAAFVDRALMSRAKLKSITVLACEIDKTLHPDLERTLQQCEQHCANSGVGFTYSIEDRDFIEFASENLQFGLFDNDRRTLAFDFVIMNPPYKKLGADSRQSRILKALGIHVPNLYAAFVAAASRLLADNGQLVAITPRSFCNGSYFRKFRTVLLNGGCVKHIHIFPSRNRAFAEDKVLQENIVFHYLKAHDKNNRVLITEGDLIQGELIQSARLSSEQIVSSLDSERVIHIPFIYSIDKKARINSTVSTKLVELGLWVSTGKVVDFRSASHLRRLESSSAAPLIYPQHFSGLGISWPKTDAKKPNAIERNDETRAFLLQPGSYVVVKRFSAKEERRRIYAALIEPEMVGHQTFAVENHVNYYHHNGIGMDSHTARGLAAYLNSTRADESFRTFSGHTQVNASDLVRLNYPSASRLKAIGKRITNLGLSQHEIDKIVEEELEK